jgi:hypothetical protein
MTEGILRRGDLDESMNDINLDEWKNLVVLCAANRYEKPQQRQRRNDI